MANYFKKGDTWRIAGIPYARFPSKEVAQNWWKTQKNIDVVVKPITQALEKAEEDTAAAAPAWWELMDGDKRDETD